jgi:hypothetical protein
MLEHAYRRRAAGGFTNDGRMGCMLEHAYRGRAAGRMEDGMHTGECMRKSKVWDGTDGEMHA